MTKQKNKINRVIVIGCPGAGKSTVALKLKDRLELPIFHLDKLFWKAGWEQQSQEDFKIEHHKIIQKKRWLIDGNYSSTMTERYQQADFVVFMNIPKWQCLLGLLKRRITYQESSRPDMNEDCPERFDWNFLKYVLSFQKTQIPLIKEILNKDPKKLIYHITSRKEANELLEFLDTI